MWNTLVPKKINLFVWRLRREALPTTINLFAKGIDVSSMCCLFCQNGVEFIDHIFQKCKLVRGSRKLLNSWLRLDLPDATPNEVLNWCDNLKLPFRTRSRTQAILFILWWCIWKARNDIRYNESRATCVGIFNAVVSLAYVWIHNRDKKDALIWQDWNEFPFGID